MKAVLLAILILAGADWALNHGEVTKRAWYGVGHLIAATGDATSDSIFSK